MEKQAVENTTTIQTTVNVTLLGAIKNFMDDLSSVTNNKNFEDYKTIVNRIDETKVKAFEKLINGFKTFFENNAENLKEGNFSGLTEPNISYVTDSGSFNFNFQQIFENSEDPDQDVIKDHLNHIWSLLYDKCPEEQYIDKIFNDLQQRFSSDMTREEQMSIAKNLFDDFQTQNLNIAIVVKVACKKMRELLLSNGSDNNSKTMVLVNAVDDIDINNFDMIQVMALISKVGTLFEDGENPIDGLMANIFTIPMDQLNIDGDDNDEINH